MATIEWTREAEFWLKDIYYYIAEDDTDTALRVVSEIYEKVQHLSSHPKMGYYLRTADDGEIRILLYGHYRIAYLLTEEDRNTVKILGIFHGAMDIDKYLS